MKTLSATLALFEFPRETMVGEAIVVRVLVDYSAMIFPGGRRDLRTSAGSDVGGRQLVPVQM